MEGDGGAASIEGANAPYGHEARRPLKGLMPLTKIGYANTSIPLLNPNKKRTSHMRGSLTLPEFVSKNPSFPDLA